MKLNPLTLVFCGVYENLEKPFIAHYHKNSLKQIRWGLGAAALFSVLFGLYDYLILVEGLAWYWAVRGGVMLPTCLALLAFTYSRPAQRYLQPALCLGTLIFGVCAILMTVRSQSNHYSAYLFCLVQTLFFVHTFLRIRFIWAVAVTGVLSMTYLLAGMDQITMPAGQFYSSAFFLIGLNLMGLMANYAMEFAARKNYYLARLLSSQKRRLATTNRFLENRVARRTSQLTRTNAQLTAEIKERGRTEKALRESELRYRQMVNTVSDYICVHDLTGRIIEVNLRMVEGLGLAEAELANRNIRDLNLSVNSRDFDDYLCHVASKGKARGTIAYIGREGHEFFLEYSSVLSDHPSGRKVVYCLARDITEARRTAIALAESQARFQEVFETAAAGMMIVDVESQNVSEINLAAARMFGEPVDHLINRRVCELMQPVGDANCAGCGVAEHGSEPAEWRLISKTAGTIPILKSAQPIEFGGRPHLVISFSDIQKIKEAEKAKRDMEAELMRSQHLQAIGTLAGGIAHDFNNILQGIIGYTQLAMVDLPEDTPIHECLDEIMQGGRRAKDLIAQILVFSRKGESRKMSINPTSLIKEALRLIRASIPTTIDIRSTIGPDIPTVMADTTQIHQVVMNLCTNAAHAMQPQGGQLSVSLERHYVVRNEETPYGTLSKGPYLKLRVMDNGQGMDKAVLERIFEPFFTTKPQGEGTGMGLSTVLGIVQSHGGALRVASEPGKGSCFDILLPAVPAVPAGAATADSRPATGSERILLIDDEKQIVQIGHRLLTRLGYTVQTCLDPKDALALFSRNPHAFDLVITDLAMPKIQGTTLIGQLRRMRADIPIILCTGNVNQVSDQQRQELGIREILAKPILRDDLARAVRRAMAPAADDFYPLAAETA